MGSPQGGVRTPSDNFFHLENIKKMCNILKMEGKRTYFFGPFPAFSGFLAGRGVPDTQIIALSHTVVLEIAERTQKYILNYVFFSCHVGPGFPQALLGHNHPICSGRGRGAPPTRGGPDSGGRCSQPWPAWRGTGGPGVATRRVTMVGRRRPPGRGPPRAPGPAAGVPTL